MKLFQKKISYKYKGRPFGWRSGPDADWKVLFTVFILGIFASAAYSTMHFFKAMNDDLTPEEAATQVNLSKEAVRRTADFYLEKATLFEKIKSTPETIADPSI